jgi:hypothetical protein
LLVLLGALSIEEVRSDPDPLDPRFYAGARGGGPGHADRVPFASHKGPTVTVSGRTLAPGDGSIDFDLWQAAAGADGARTHLGKLSIEPGAFSLQVPASFGALQIEAFQDLTGDGPTVDDPFGQLALEVGDTPLADLELSLVEGGLASILSAGGGPDGAGAGHQEAAPGAPGGDPSAAPPEDPSAAPPEDLPFADTTGPTVTLSGHASTPVAGPIDLDLWQPDPDADGARIHLGKLSVEPGVVTLEVPASFGPLEIEAFQDLTGDGPSADDPFAKFTLVVEATPVVNLDLALETGAWTGGGDAEHTEAAPGAPGGDPTAVPTEERPFAEYEGPTVALSGGVAAPVAKSVDLDFWKPDPTAAGSRAHLGKLTVEPGGFSLKVPSSFGPLQIEAFQDLTGDGPTPDDPFGRLDLVVRAAALTNLKLTLAVGAMAASGSAEHTEAAPGAPGGEAHTHVEAAPGAPGGDPTAGVHDAAPGAPGGEAHPHVEAAPGAPGGDTSAAPSTAQPAPDPFATVAGPRVRVSGTVVYPDARALLDMDIFQIEPNVQGGRAFVGKQKVAAGDFVLSLPVSFGKVDLEVFLDRGGDGPTPGDPFATCPANPISLTSGDVKGLRIEVAPAASTAAPAP